MFDPTPNQKKKKIIFPLEGHVYTLCQSFVNNHCQNGILRNLLKIICICWRVIASNTCLILRHIVRADFFLAIIFVVWLQMTQDL